MNFGLERAFESKDVYTIVFLLIFTALTFIKLKFPKMFTGLLMSFFSKSMFFGFTSDLNANLGAFNMILFQVQNFILSLFFYLIYIYKVAPNETENSFLLIFIFLGVTFFFAVQYFVSFLLAKLFNFVSVFKSIHVLRFIYLKLVSLIMLPFLLLIIYGNKENQDVFINIAMVVFTLLMLLRAVLVLVKNNKLIIEKLFYFIVYLCTLEIVPLLLIYKIIVKNSI